MSKSEHNELVKQWISRAEEDFINARYTLSLKEDCPLGTICFHSQQCVEKYLKAMLTQDVIAFPRTHDLIELLNLFPLQNKPELALQDLAVLNRYAVEARYPGDWEPVTRQDAKEAFLAASQIRQTIRDALFSTE
jgi:HEPN domain-containing protein